MKKLKLMLLTIILSAFMVTVPAATIAFAESSDEVPQEATQEESEKDLVELVKDYIAPMVAGLSTSLVTILPLAVIYLRTNMRFKAQSGGYETLKKRCKELESELKSVADIDYKAVFEAVANNRLAEFSNQIATQFEALKENAKVNERCSAESLAEQKLTQESIEKIAAAMSVAWGSKPEIRELLSSLPSVAVLKKEVLKNEKLKGVINDIKGEEADKIIAEVEKSIEVAS